MRHLKTNVDSHSCFINIKHDDLLFTNRNPSSLTICIYDINALNDFRYETSYKIANKAYICSSFTVPHCHQSTFIKKVNNIAFRFKTLNKC